MKIYKVGGCVRDQCLGRPATDVDYVVVGATPDQLMALGYKPVGADFPVFLHPISHAEYALARTERKTAPGYKGFTFHADASVTLEQDLARRDFTINAMALDEAGQLIDPFGGASDLTAGVLRHVSEAFAEDPVRILRGARFAARFGFTIAPETLVLMRELVGKGEVDHLVPERVWQELARGLMEDAPVRMLTVLRECGALAVLIPELDRLWGVPQSPQHHPEVDTGRHMELVLALAASAKEALPVRFACLMHDLGKGTTPKEELPRHLAHEHRGIELVEAVCARLKVPSECRDLAVMACREHLNVHRSQEVTPAKLHDLLTRCDAWRRPARFDELLRVCEYDARGREGLSERAYPQPAYLRACLEAARTLDVGAVATMAKAAGRDIPDAVRRARIGAIKRASRAVRSDDGGSDPLAAARKVAT
jgi:tRNA nucleotidyltransferase (CCA-adding enzyme)